MAAFDRMPCSSCGSCKHMQKITGSYPYSCYWDSCSDVAKGAQCTRYEARQSGSNNSGQQQGNDSYGQSSGLSCTCCGRGISGKYWSPGYESAISYGERMAVKQRIDEGAIYCSTSCITEDIYTLGRQLESNASARENANLAEVSRRIGYQAKWEDIHQFHDLNNRSASLPFARSSDGHIHISEYKREVKPTYDAFVNAGIAMPSLEETMGWFKPCAYKWYFEDGIWKLLVDSFTYGINDIAALKTVMEKRVQFAAPNESLPEHITCEGYGEAASNVFYCNRTELNLFAQSKYGKEAKSSNIWYDSSKKKWFFDIDQKTLFGFKTHVLKWKDIPPIVFAPIRNVDDETFDDDDDYDFSDFDEDEDDNNTTAATNAGEAAFEKGVKYFNNSEFNNAILAFTDAINLGCKDMSNAYYYRADEYRMTKQYDKAISDCTSAINLYKDNAVAYGTRGDSYRMKSEYDKAISDYDKAIALNPSNDFALGGRGSAYRMKGNKAQAVSDLEKALKLNPGNAFAKNELELAKK